MKRIVEFEEVYLGVEKFYRIIDNIRVNDSSCFLTEEEFNNLTKPLPSLKEEDDKLLNCKFFVVEGSVFLFEGYIYEVINGKFKNSESSGWFPLDRRLSSFKELEEYLENEYSTAYKIKVMKVEE